MLREEPRAGHRAEFPEEMSPRGLLLKKLLYHLPGPLKVLPPTAFTLRKGTGGSPTCTAFWLGAGSWDASPLAAASSPHQLHLL